MQSNTILWLSVGGYAFGVVIGLMFLGAENRNMRIAPWKDISDWLAGLVIVLLWPLLLVALVIGGIGYIIIGLFGIIVQSIMFVGYWLGSIRDKRVRAAKIAAMIEKGENQ